MTEILYGEPLDKYLANPRLSTHLMSTFCDSGPRMFIMRSGNMLPDKEQTDEQRVGQMFEDLVQGRAPDMSKIVARPAGMKFNEGKKDDETSGRGWKALQDRLGMTVMEQEDLDGMRWMHESFLENSEAMEIVNHAEKQVTMYDRSGMFGLKSRPDYVLDGFTTVDLKTCASLNQVANGKAVREWRYHCQAALCRRLMRPLYENGNSVHYLLAVEKKMPYRCQLLRFSSDWLDRGDRWADEQIAGIEACARADSWPRVLEECRNIAPPPSWL